MKFLDLVDSKENHIGEIVRFDDGVYILKLCISRKVYCFDNYSKLLKYIVKSLRLKDITIINNGITEIEDDDEDEEDEN